MGIADETFAPVETIQRAARVIADIREPANEQRPRRLGRFAERKLRVDILLDELPRPAPLRGKNFRSYLRVVRGPIETGKALPPLCVPKTSSELMT
jgi:hypothetical protein